MNQPKTSSNSNSSSSDNKASTIGPASANEYLKSDANHKTMSPSAISIAAADYQQILGIQQQQQQLLSSRDYNDLFAVESTII